MLGFVWAVEKAVKINNAQQNQNTMFVDLRMQYVRLGGRS